MENSFFRHSRHATSRKIHLTSLNRMAFIRKQNPFVDFAVTEFVYVLSEPYRPKRLSGAMLALALPAPEPGVPD